MLVFHARIKSVLKGTNDMAGLIKIVFFLFSCFVVIINQYRELYQEETKRSCTFVDNKIPKVYSTHILLVSENIEKMCKSFY